LPLTTRSVVSEREMFRVSLVTPRLREPRSSLDLRAHLSARVGSRIDRIEPLLHIRFNANVPLKRHRLELNSVRLRDVRMRVNERHAPVGKKFGFSKGWRGKLLKCVESNDRVRGAVHDTLLKEQDTASAQLRDAGGSAEILAAKSSWLSQVRR
jgi:hypothetical protein